LDTLPDYLEKGLDIVLVGLNPSDYSVREGHYFANPRNRFWAAFNASGLVGRPLSAADDHRMIEYGIGFTDVVKRPTSQASHLKASDHRQWAPILKEKLERVQPLIACFQGLMAYGIYLRHAEGVKERPRLGLQTHTLGSSKIFVVPNPSPANAQYSLEDLAMWYQKLKNLKDGVKAGG
jgi:TDG/mug DNA glycosylase family protein